MPKLPTQHFVPVQSSAGYDEEDHLITPRSPRPPHDLPGHISTIAITFWLISKHSSLTITRMVLCSRSNGWLGKIYTEAVGNIYERFTADTEPNRAGSLGVTGHCARSGSRLILKVTHGERVGAKYRPSGDTGVRVHG